MPWISRAWTRRAGGRRALYLAIATSLVAMGAIGFATYSAADDPVTVQISSGPSGTEASSGATFTFSASDLSASLECSLDGAAFSPCTSPKDYAGLENGEHFFNVRVQPVDGSPAGSADASWNAENLMPCTAEDQPANFPIYSSGPSVAGLGVNSITRRCDDLQPGAPARANFVSYTYGVCPQVIDGTESMCAPPLEVQSWPACERSLADYELQPGVPYPHEKLGRLDGVPAYSFDGGTRLELYTATTTIVVFAADPDVLDQAIADIQLEPDSQAPGQPSASSDSASDLPDPVAGALAGRLACT